ncbi:MAG: DUF1553 domain-containing protein [Saprospiraceae bacterium]|nr:DUF1553 domain-containing protein [Saprospiraceae bacterium]
MDRLVSEQIDSLETLNTLDLEAINLREQEIVKQIDFIRNLPKDNWSLKRQIYLPFEQLHVSVLDQQANAKVTSGVDLISSERGMAVAFDDEYDYINISEVGLFEQSQSFSASVWVKPDLQKASQTIMGNSGQKGVFWRGWDFILDSLNRPTLRLIHALPQDMLVVRSSQEIASKQWTHLAFVYDGSGHAYGIKFYINGLEIKPEIVRNQLQRSIYPMAFSKEKVKTPLRIGKSYRAFTGEYGIYEGLMDDLMVFERKLSGLEIASLAGIQTLDAVRKDYLEGGTEDLQSSLQEHYLTLHPVAGYQIVAERRQQIISWLDKVPEVMIMQDQAQPVVTHLLIRGNYDQPGEVVLPGTPKAIFALADTLPRNRLGLARWMIASDNPLTSRVIVNRIWQKFLAREL